MKKFLFIILLMMISSAFTSCEKEEPEWYNGKEKLWNPDVPLVPKINNTEKTVEY